MNIAMYVRRGDGGRETRPIQINYKDVMVFIGNITFAITFIFDDS